MNTFECSFYDINLLSLRCLYFSAMISFNFGNLESFLDIQIPIQNYLSESECAILIRVLTWRGMPDILRVLDDFTYDALIFFASFFQCDLILDYVIYSMWNPKRASRKGLIRILKLSCIFFSLIDVFTDKVIKSIADYLGMSEEFIVRLIHLADFKGELQAMRLLSRKLRDVSRRRRLIFSQFSMFCACCNLNIRFNYKGSCNGQVVFLKCCLRPIHLSPCFEAFVSRSFDMQVYCPVCRACWFYARPFINIDNREYRICEYLQFFRDQKVWMVRSCSDLTLNM